MARNLKLWNHWIAELRDIAIKKKLKVELTENETRPMRKSEIKYLFDRSTMGEAFEEGQTPLEALENELDYWEP